MDFSEYYTLSLKESRRSRFPKVLMSKLRNSTFLVGLVAHDDNRHVLAAGLHHEVPQVRDLVSLVIRDD